MRFKVLLFLGLFLSVVTVQAQQCKDKMQFGLYVSGVKMIGGDRDNSMISPWVGLSAGYNFSPKLGVQLEWASGWDRAFDTSKSGIGKYFIVHPNSPYRTYLYPLTINAKYGLTPDKTINPYLLGGMGVLIWDLRKIDGEDSINPLTPKGESVYGTKTNFLLNLGIGADFFVTPGFAFDFSLRYQQFISQTRDMSGMGDKQTGNIEARFGLNFFLCGTMDQDKDGIEDKLDGCPEEAEDIDGFMDEDGCPDYDNDGDEIPDYLDQAPNLPEDYDGFQDEDGIPDPDNDGDGITDDKDKCDDMMEDFDGFQDDDGCPDPDNDNDGIPDEIDKCPNSAENINDFQDDDGCPDEAPQPEIDLKQPMVLKGVTFQSGSSQLTESAKAELDSVYQTLVHYPDLMLQIRGHTDNVGGRDSNIRLSSLRAESVKTFLVALGINPNRLETIGFGPDKPIATNSTPEGRAMNRRIEFVRIER